MKKKIICNFIFIGTLFFVASCAQIVPLSGGKKDTDSPKLISSSPPQGSLQFNGFKVELLFDELIKLNSSSQINITPGLTEQPEIIVNGKKLVLTFKEKLKDNTTYFIYFGNSIADITENNSTHELQLYFSTGNSIDSSFIHGNVINAEDLNPIVNASIGLYTSFKDSVAFFEKPLYSTQTNSNGEFKIPFVKKGTYQIIAIEDANKNKVYDIGERIAFEINKLILDSNLFVKLKSFKEESDKLFFKKTISISPEKFLILLNKKIDSLKKYSLLNSKNEPPLNFKIHHKTNSDSIFIFLKNNLRDTFYVKLEDVLEDSKIISQGKDELKILFNKRRYPFEIKPLMSEKNNFPFYASLKFHSNFLISEINYSKISIRSEGKEINFSERDVRFLDDSIFIDFKWKEQSSYEVLLYPGALKDYFDRTNDTIKINFKTNGSEDYGSLTLSFQKCKTNKILQLINSKNICVFQKSIKDEDNLKTNRLLPDTYSLRVVTDLNMDNKFTTGNFIKRIQPEKINLSKEIIKLVAGWENELKLNDDFLNDTD